MLHLHSLQHAGLTTLNKLSSIYELATEYPMLAGNGITIIAFVSMERKPGIWQGARERETWGICYAHRVGRQTLSHCTFAAHKICHMSEHSKAVDPFSPPHVFFSGRL